MYSLDNITHIKKEEEVERRKKKETKTEIFFDRFTFFEKMCGVSHFWPLEHYAHRKKNEAKEEKKNKPLK